MNGGKQPRGYTIIEVMIVLAVSGVMFLIAASFISGKQEASTFQAGVREMASRLQDMLEQVNDGQYSDIPLICTPASGSSSYYSTYAPDANVGAGHGQGTDSSCTFMGKLIQFDYNGHQNQYEEFTLGGLRLTDTTTPSAVTTIAQAKISPVGGLAGDSIDLTDTQTVPQSLNVISMSIKANDLNSPNNFFVGTASPNRGVGFIEGLPTAGGSDPDTYASGEQYPSMVWAPIPTGANESTAANALTNSTGQVAQTQSAQKIKLCLSDGNRYATLIIATNDQYGLGVVTNFGVTAASCVTDLSIANPA